MKTISIRQPWAELLLLRHKTIEVRTWNTRHRGPILIHASSSVDLNSRWNWQTNPLKTGAIVGVGYLSKVKKYPDFLSFVLDKFEHLNEEDQWEPKGLYGWVIEAVTPLQQSIPYKGKLGLWEPNKETMELITSFLKSERFKELNSFNSI